MQKDAECNSEIHNKMNETDSTSEDEERKRLIAKYKAPGWAQIKEEFIDFKHKRTITTEYMPQKIADKISPEEPKQPSEETSEPPQKKAKLKGRNKKRPFEKRIDNSERLCYKFLQTKKCQFGDKCRFSHDVENFVKNKPQDIGDECPIFNVYGYCKFGVCCRFAKSHLTADYTNIVNEELWNKMKDVPFSCNTLLKEIQGKLWKRKYDFLKVTAIIKELYAEDEPKVNTCENMDNLGTHKIDSDFTKDNANVDQFSISENHVDQTNSSTNGNKSNIPECNEYKNLLIESLKSLDSCEDVKDSSTINSSEIVDESSSFSTEKVNESTPLASANNVVLKSASIETNCLDNTVYESKVKKIDFKNKLYLAPLTTVGNLPFRAVCKAMGADITCGEMAVGTSLLQGSQSEWALLKRHSSEDVFGVQILSSHPEVMTKSAKLLVDNCDVDFIDINCGCPIDLIFRKGEGSAMMAHPNKLLKSIKGMKSIMGALPLTVKLRTGIYEEKNIAHSLIPKIKECGVELFTLHGRTREQRYTKFADWDYINECAELASPIPLFGNGDILSYEDSNIRLRDTTVAGVMIGRGALIKPWIFTEIKEQRHWDISANERFDLIKKFVNFGLEHWGSDEMGVSTTRKFLLEWLSFSHRYVPVGLLERVPIRINERPPYYFGRNDLETLLSSSNCTDWVKISEMCLGPVPDSFQFLPKHKANSYK